MFFWSCLGYQAYSTNRSCTGSRICTSPKKRTWCGFSFCMRDQNGGCSIKHHRLQRNSRGKKVSSGIARFSRLFLKAAVTSFFTLVVNTMGCFSQDTQSISVLYQCSLVHSWEYLYDMILKECCPWAAKKEEKVRASLELKNLLGFFFLILNMSEKAILNKKRMLWHSTVNTYWEGELIRKELEPSAWQIHDPWSWSVL